MSVGLAIREGFPEKVLELGHRDQMTCSKSPTAGSGRDGIDPDSSTTSVSDMDAFPVPGLMSYFLPWILSRRLLSVIFKHELSHCRETKAPDIYAVSIRLGLSFLALRHLPKTDGHRSTWSDLMARCSWGKKRKVGTASK